MLARVGRNTAPDKAAREGAGAIRVAARACRQERVRSRGAVGPLEFYGPRAVIRRVSHGLGENAGSVFDVNENDKQAMRGDQSRAK
jgi:hypothetical protein